MITFSFGLLALRLTRLTAHWQPQQVQRVSLSKLVPTRHCNSCRKHTAMAKFAAIQRAAGETSDFKSSHRKQER